jgi:hypothetical protein
LLDSEEKHRKKGNMLPGLPLLPLDKNLWTRLYKFKNITIKRGIKRHKEENKNEMEHTSSLMQQ